MASFLDSYSDKISLAGLGRLTGINPKQLSHYLNEKRNPSPKTVKKIEAALHEFGKEISQKFILFDSKIASSVAVGRGPMLQPHFTGGSDGGVK